MYNIESRGPGRVPLDKTSRGASPRVNFRLTAEQLVTYAQIGGANAIREFLDGIGCELAKSLDDVKNLESEIHQIQYDIGHQEMIIDGSSFDDEVKQEMWIDLHRSSELCNSRIDMLESAMNRVNGLRTMCRGKTPEKS